MSRKQKVKIYSCVNCGSSFQAYPPDDLHTVASRNKDSHKDNIVVNYRCKDCKRNNTIYWGVREFGFAIG